MMNSKFEVFERWIPEEEEKEKFLPFFFLSFIRDFSASRSQNKNSASEVPKRSC